MTLYIHFISKIISRILPHSAVLSVFFITYCIPGALTRQYKKGAKTFSPNNAFSFLILLAFADVILQSNTEIIQKLSLLCHTKVSCHPQQMHNQNIQFFLKSSFGI